MFKGEDYAHFWIEEGILNFIYKPNIILDLNEAKAVVKARLRLQQGKTYPILCDIRQLKFSSKAAREYMAVTGCLKALAIAFVMEEAYSGTMVTAFMKISKPTVPTRAFTTTAEALSFLKRFK